MIEKIKGLFNRAKRFLSEARAELRKVTWPTPKQALASTAVVIVLVAIVSLILGLFDFILAKLVKLLLG